MRVFVGLSGGVDSAVSAALLKEQGHDVTGVFIKIWSPEFLECTWQVDRLEAKRVAAHLEIPFLEIDLSKEYLNLVVKDMLANYEKGFTPNPDVLCNTSIKFGAFLSWALAHGADAVATGHYARVEKRGGEYVLLKGIDPAKDQSYFLHRLTQDTLRKIVFPVGWHTKSQIREKAKHYGLPNAERPDSQGLCFVGDVSMHEFLGRFIKLRMGVILDEAGLHIGEHDGAALYTIGQRHGFHLRSGFVGPYYVTAVDTVDNIVHASKKWSDTGRLQTLLLDLHWIRGSARSVDAVSRYHAPAVRAEVVGSLDGYEAKFATPTQLTPGQSLVFYSKDECLGGAVIGNIVDNAR